MKLGGIAVVACKQAPKVWHRGKRAESGASRAPPSLSFSPQTELDFSLRPIPHLGASSQAKRYNVAVRTYVRQSINFELSFETMMTNIFYD